MTVHSNIDYLKKKGQTTGIFYFKQFKVEDSRSTMKVGTDAVLLGSVADVTEVANILEIGTGCGVISLMLAQQSNARIDAIEINEESANQARENARMSPWKDRITIINRSLQDFSHHPEKKYDLIISNPPYFYSSLKSNDRKRNISRHNDLLSFNELVDGASLLMNPGASFWVILPIKESKEFMNIAGKAFLFIHFIMKIIPKTGKAYHRVILQFKKTLADKIEEKNLTIRNADDTYSREYIEATKDFYVDF
jgi:tRNA1Val (adenine37-N6)-methyltransferase